MAQPNWDSAPNWWKQVRDYNTKYHPWTPPATLEAWTKQRKALQTQILVSQGLWPMPEKTPLQPVVHGAIEEDDYIIEKVFFASRPGLYVTGNLYRPKTVNGPVPGILCPHGHWRDGRFYDAGEAAATEQIEQSAEVDLNAARYPVQARMVQLARMGAIVFHYDMIGYADHAKLMGAEGKAIDHRWDFSTARDGLWLIENMGLQTWNSIRALDFLCSLEDVDQSRLAITGASGGGTQTMLLAAIDDRLIAAVPAVMVSTDMQGGCTCENAPYLRIDTNNAAFASLFAPKPQGMIGADDWTINLLSTGFPEIKSIYSLYGVSDQVAAWVHPEFKHNYNHVSRTHMYAWLAEHLELNASAEERPFRGKTAQELSVFDHEYPVPEDAVSAAQLKDLIITENQAQLEMLQGDSAGEYLERVIKPAAVVMLGGPAPEASEVIVSLDEFKDETEILSAQISRVTDGTVISVQLHHAEKVEAAIVIQTTDQGLQATAELEMLHSRYPNAAVLLTEIRGTGRNRPADDVKRVNEQYYGYTHCYNLPLLSMQVQDLLTVITAARDHHPDADLILSANGDSAVAALLAQAQAGDSLVSVDVTLSPKQLRDINDVNDPLFIPGWLKYGGLDGLASINPCQKMTLRGLKPDQQARFQLLRQEVDQLKFD